MSCHAMMGGVTDDLELPLDAHPSVLIGLAVERWGPRGLMDRCARLYHEMDWGDEPEAARINSSKVPGAIARAFLPAFMKMAASSKQATAPYRHHIDWATPIPASSR